MELKILLFAKIKLHSGVPNIFFALRDNELLSYAIANQSLDDFVKTYNLKRYNEFDTYINKGLSLRYLLEWQASKIENLPKEIKISNEIVAIKWLLFPQAAKILTKSFDKNFLQLSVQYISNGGIDENVIAADFDEAFIKTLQKNHSD